MIKERSLKYTSLMADSEAEIINFDTMIDDIFDRAVREYNVTSVRKLASQVNMETLSRNSDRAVFLLCSTKAYLDMAGKYDEVNISQDRTKYKRIEDLEEIIKILDNAINDFFD